MGCQLQSPGSLAMAFTIPGLVVLARPSSSGKKNLVSGRAFLRWGLGFYRAAIRKRSLQASHEPSPEIRARIREFDEGVKNRETFLGPFLRVLRMVRTSTC
jgi:hypothetical protein